MKRPIKALLLVTGLAGAILAPFAHAAPPEGFACEHGSRTPGFYGHGTDTDRRIDFMVESLGLSAKQRDDLRAIADKLRPQKRELHDKLAENRKQLHDLMQQPKPEDNELRKLADNQGRLIADLMVLHGKEWAAMRSVLTPEQQDRLQQRHGWRRQSSSLDEIEPHSHLSSLSM